MNHTCLFLPSQSWSSFTDYGGMECWVGLGGWLHTKISVQHRELNPDKVTHLSTNRSRCRLASWIKINVLLLCETATFIIIIILYNKIVWTRHCTNHSEHVAPTSCHQAAACYSVATSHVSPLQPGTSSTTITRAVYSIISLPYKRHLLNMNL